MLNHNSMGGPGFKDPTTKVRVLVPIFVGGKEYAVGDTVNMPMSEALYSKNMCTPSRVEII
jgi:hypothetical protein